MPGFLDNILKEISTTQGVDPNTGLIIKPIKNESYASDKVQIPNQQSIPMTKDEFESFSNRELMPSTTDFQYSQDQRALQQTNLDATANALTKFVGKTAITVGDTLLGSALSIPIAIVNGDFTKFYDNDVRRFFDSGSEYLDDNLKIYATKAQEQEGFFSKLNNAQFWGDGVLGGMSFTVGAVLSEMALSFITASTFGAGATVQAAETATLLSRAKKIFGFFGKEADVLAYKTLAKDVVKSAAIGAGYEAGVEARNFLDTARKNYAEQYKQQYGVEPNAQQLAEADGEIKKTANLIFGANMALLSVDNFIQFKNIFGKGLSTDLKLFGKSAVNTEAKDLAKDYALRGTLNAAFENTSKLRKALYTTAKVIKNPLTEMNEEALQGEFQAIGQDYIKKKFDATAYDDSFSLIESFGKNFKDTYGSEDAGIGFIIGAMGIPGMGIATGKTKNVKGFGNKIIASFEGGIAEAFEEQNAEKTAIKTAINQSSKVNIDNVQEQVKSNSAIYTSNKLRDEALENGDFFEAKNHESDALFSFVKSRDNVGLLNESKEQYATMIKEMDTADFAKQFGYDKIGDGEVSLSKPQLEERKNKVIEQFNKKIDNFQETKELASKVAPVRNFNDKDARLFNEAIHHLMYTTNDLDSREDSLVKTINDKLAKSGNENEKLKELVNFHNTWSSLTEDKLSKQIEEYDKNLNILKEQGVIDVPTEDGLNSKITKAQAKVKELKDTIQAKLNEINKSKEKLSKVGYNINNNFLNVDNFTNAHNEFKQLQKDIENHLGQNVFDKDTIKQSIDDLAKIQSRRKDLIGTYNELNTKNGREKFDKEVKKNERNAKIEYLKIQARKFLHNQGLELDKDTVKEIENNVDLQVKEDDSPEVKAQKQAINTTSDNIDNETNIDVLKSQIEDLKQFKELVGDDLKIHINTLIAKATQKIKDLKASQDITNTEIIQDRKEPIFSDINEVFRLMNKDNPAQSEKLNEVISELNKETNKNTSLEENLRKRISFTLTDLENALPVDVTEATQKNSNVKIVKGIRSGETPFQIHMKIDGVEVGGFQMPNQIYLNLNNTWSQIDFTKLDNDAYLQEILKMLFPQELVSTSEDRLKLGQYLTELNNFSNKLSQIKDRKEFSFEEFDKLMKGQISKNEFTDQLKMNITRDVKKVGDDLTPIETKVEDILDDEDNVITKAATKTIVVNGVNQNIILFGQSSANGKGFSKTYFVRVINGKLERNENGSVKWNQVEGSLEQKEITPLLEKKPENLNTKDSLFSLLVFNPNGELQPLFTTNETIGKLKGVDPNESFITTFLSNKSNLQPLTQVIGDNMIDFLQEKGNKKSSEFENKDFKDLDDIFFSIKNTGNTNIKITTRIEQSELKFKITTKTNEKNEDGKVISKSTFINTYIYFNGENFIKLDIKDQPEAQVIFESYKNNEITLAEKLEKLKSFSKVINLNEEIGKLILEGEQKQNKEGTKFYNLHSAIRGITGNNNLNITGFYNGISLNTTNQQDLENLTIKQKLNYYLYLRPDVTRVKDITSFSKNTEAQIIENKETQEKAQYLRNLAESKVIQQNEVKLEAHEEAKTIEQVVKSSPVPSVSNSDDTNANTAALSNLMNTSSIINEELLKQAAKNIGLPAFIANSIERLKTALTTNEKLKAEYDKLNPQPIEVVDKKADIENKQINKYQEWLNRLEAIRNGARDQNAAIQAKNLANEIFQDKQFIKGLPLENSQDADGIYRLMSSRGELIDALKAEIKYNTKTEVKQTPNIDSLEALGIPLKEILDSTKIIGNVKAFEGKYKFLSKKYGFDLTLEEFTNAVLEIKKSELSSEGVNKLLKLSDADLIEYNIAIKNLAQILPIKTQDNPNGTIEVTDLIDILGNLKTKGEVGGRFIAKLKTIYLATKEGKSVKGFEYHEAFHAVFRMLLTDSQISKYLKSAEELYGTPNDSQLEELKNSSSDLIRLSKTQLKNIWLEEKMADAFMEHKVVPQSWLARLFNKIRAFINGIFNVNQDTRLSNENTITQLFNDIYQGKFKNAKEKYPLQRDIADANKLLEKSQTFRGENGAIIEKEGYFTHSISEAVINTITNEIADKLKRENKRNIHPDEIQKVIENFAETINPYSEHYQNLLNSIKDDNLRTKKELEISDLYSNLQYQNNIETITLEVLNRLPLYNLETTENEDLEEEDFQEDEISDTGIVQKKTNEINHAWEKASKRVKQYISSVSMKTDLFGIGQPFLDFIDDKNFNFALNGNQLYNNLIKILVGTPSYKHLGMLYSMSSTSPEVKAFTHQWFKDIYNDLKKDSSTNLAKINTDDFDALYKALNSLYYNTLSKSQYFTTVTSDLEKNRIYLQDILFDNNGSTKMINANNRDVSKQVFDRWEKNWDSKRISNLKSIVESYNEVIYKGDTDNILNDYLNLLQNRNTKEKLYGGKKENLTSEEQAKYIIDLFNNFKNEFNNLGIELPEQYIKYSLLNYVVSINRQELLTQDQLDWYNNFSSADINTINLEFLNGIDISFQKALKYNTLTIFNDLDNSQTPQPDLGAMGKLTDIAESVAIFDSTVTPSSFNNQEGKRISDIVPPSDISRRLNILKDKNNLNLIKSYLETGDSQDFKNKVLNNEINNTYYFYSFFTNESQVDNFLQALDHNPLVNNTNVNLNTLFTMSYAGGIRQIESEVKEKENNSSELEIKNYGLFSDEEGKSYSNADDAAKILYRLSLLAKSKFNEHNIKSNKAKTEELAYFIPSQFEGKSTVPMIQLPLQSLVKSNIISEKGKNQLYSIFNQEYNRITKTQNEIEEFFNGKKDGYNEGFHYILQKIGIEGTNGNRTLKVFKNKEGDFFYLDIENNNNAVILKPEELWFNEQQEDKTYIKKNILPETLIPRGLKFFNLINEKANVNQFAQKAIKGEQLTPEEITEVKNNLSTFIHFQFDKFIDFLKQSDINLINSDGTVNILPLGFINHDKESNAIISDNTVDKEALLNAFLNDYLMSYSINSLLYGDNATTTKDSVDWVKRAGGMIGSGPNYGSGKTNLILLRSEVKNGIDTTDAQTFSTPFWHLMTILKGKYLDGRVMQIYQGIDSGLGTYINEKGEIKRISKEDEDYLYANQAQHQPNKTQGFTQDGFLKTSIGPITRDIVSRLKDRSSEGKENAIRKHKDLFDLKLQMLNSSFNSAQDIRYFKHIVREYQNLFEPIFGKEYKHNLLNSMELESSIAVYDSAWKRSKVNIHENKNGQPYLYIDESGKKVVKTISIPNASLIDQQKTDGVKAIITDATQKLRLIPIEQIDETLVYFKDKEVDIKTVLDNYGKQLADRTAKGFNELKKQIINEKDGSAKWDVLLDSFIESTSKASADPQQLEFFQQGNSSKPKYNLNNPAIETKFQAMFLAFISNGTLKQKVAGSKGALYSSIGHELEREIDNEGNVIKTFTTEQSKRDNAIRGANRVSQRLRHDVYDKEKHEYYSEIVVSERFLRKFGYTKEQFEKGEIPEEFLYIQGVRIPTEDKHSMINAKIVDILPDSYGNAVMVADEIIELSGADFDIDSLYMRVYQTYSNVLNKKTEIYASYLNKPSIEEAKEQAYNEYLASKFEDRKISLTFKELKNTNEELTKLNNRVALLTTNLKDFSDITDKGENVIRNQISKTKVEIKSLELTLLEHSFNINKITFNKEEWLKENSKAIEDNYNAYQSGNIQDIKGLTKGETNNILLELERKLTNNTGNNKIANTPTSLELFKSLVKALNKEDLIDKNLGFGIHDMLSKMLADKAIAAGDANIGPVALFNNLFGLLNKNKVAIQVDKDTSIPFTLYSKDRNNKILPEAQAQRVQDTIATILAAMTDNAKEQLASQFNLTTSTLPVALTMIAVGHNFDNVMLLMKSHAVKLISEIDSQFRRTVKSQEDYDRSKSKETTKEKVEAMFELTNAPEFKGELTYDVLLKSLKYWNAKPEVENDIKNHSMSYKMTASENLTGKDTSTIDLINEGLRTATTRSYPLGKVGDIITFENQSQQYRITNIEQLTEENVKDENWIKNWSEKEQWTEDHFKSVLGGKTVHIGSWQTTFEKVEQTPIIETKTTNDGKTGIKKIISGGQTGGDLGGLEGAKLLNIETGGTAPPNFISGNKSEKQLLQSYGLVEGEQDSTTYTKRTMKNVDDSDGTVAILWGTSVGTGKTIGYAQTKKWQYGNNESKSNGYKPVLVIKSKNVDEAAKELRDFVIKNNIQVLNIAGHRETSQKGIQEFTKQVIQKAFENNDTTKPLKTKAEQLDLFNNQISNDDLHQKSILQEIVNQYFFYKEASDILSNLQNLLQLIKGFRNTFSEAERFIQALNKLGYSVNEDYTDIVKNTKITDKFNKEYKATKDVLGDGVDKILNDVFLKQTIKTAIDLMKVSQPFFISQTPTAKKTREDISILFKDSKKTNLDFQSNLRKSYLSFLTVSAYIKSVENSDAKLPKMEEFLLTPLEEIVKDETKENSDLQNVFLEIVEYNYKNGIKNDFLSFIRPNNIDYVKKQKNRNTLYGYRLNSFIADARKVKNPDHVLRLISGYNELYFAENDNILEEDPEVRRINTLKTQWAKDMFKLLIVKDGLMYRNTSFIKAIDPILFQGTSKALDEVQSLFNNEKATQKDFIDTFGKTKEELNLDFIMKFGLHQNNYFDLKSQQLIILQSFNKWLETNKLSEEESKEVINDNEVDVETELVLEDKYPIFWDEKEGTLVVNEFARITKGNNDPKLRKENKKFILSDKVAVFKKVPTPFKVNNEVKTYDKIGFPLTFYVTHGEKGKRTPLKLAVIQDTINVNGAWITFQMTPEGKVTELSNSTKDLLKDKVYYGDLQTNTIYQIINDSVKLKTFDRNKTQLVEIAKALANQFKDGYVTGTKAKYNEAIILGSGEVSSFGSSVEAQEAMSLSEEKTKNVKLNMFNRKEKPKADETPTKENLVKLLNEHSAISKFTLKDVENYSATELEEMVEKVIIKQGFTKEQAQEKTKKCYSKS